MENEIRLTLRISADINELLEQAKKEQGASKNTIIVNACKKLVKELDK